MEIKTLEAADKKEILNVFNASFANYLIPMKLSEAQFTLKMSRDKIDLGVSVGAFENGSLIAFILHGLDNINKEKVVYNAGTGVIPKKRGSGLTKKMYRFIFPTLIKKGVDKLMLEVITENIQALQSYKKSGFKTNREVLCYKGKANLLNTTRSIEVKKMFEYNWEVMESFWDVHPTWQNSKNVVNALQNSNFSLGAYIESDLIGYVIYNPAQKRIQQIAVKRDFRQKGIASTLVLELINSYGNMFSVINVDKSSECLNAFLTKIGLEINIRQLEMICHLGKRRSYQ